MATITLRPDAAGDLTTLGTNAPPNWDAVNDVTPDGDTTCVCNDYYAGGVRDLYNLPLPSGVGVINSITVVCCCRCDSLHPARQINTLIKTGGIIYEGVNTAPTTSYVNYQTVYTLNPQTGVAWTWSNINALQIGVFLSGSDTYCCYCTQVYVEIDYIPYIDVGLRIKTSNGIIKIGVKALEASHKLRIRKGATTYGIPLLAINDAYASGLRIYDGANVKALPKVA